MWMGMTDGATAVKTCVVWWSGGALGGGFHVVLLPPRTTHAGIKRHQRTTKTMMNRPKRMSTRSRAVSDALVVVSTSTALPMRQHSAKRKPPANAQPSIWFGIEYVGQVHLGFDAVHTPLPTHDPPTAPAPNTPSGQITYGIQLSQRCVFSASPSVVRQEEIPRAATSAEDQPLS